MPVIVCLVRCNVNGTDVADNRTQPAKASVTEFINAIDDREKRADARKVAAMMRKATS